MKYEKSCGAIIIENEKILLIQNVDGHWDFPKGHVEEGETEEETAIREVKEETNINIKIETTRRYVNHYSPKEGVEKDVILFLGKKIGGEEKRQEEEVSKIEWLNYDEAIERLTYDNTKEVLKKFLKDLK